MVIAEMSFIFYGAPGNELLVQYLIEDRSGWATANTEERHHRPPTKTRRVSRLPTLKSHDPQHTK